VASAEAPVRFPPEFMQELRRRTDLVAVVAEKVALRPAGRELVGLCPFHEEKTPSFYVSPDKQVYYCHGCHAGGDAIDFLMRTRGMGFGEAVAELAARAGLRLPAQRPLSAEERRRQAQREEWQAALEAAAAFFREALLRPEGAEAIAYLRRRGVDGPTAERFGLGYAPAERDGLVRALGRRFAPERLVEVGLAVQREGQQGPSDLFRRRLMFPIWDERGRVIGFGGRALAPADKPKYLNSPQRGFFQKRRVLYALHLARPAAQARGRVVVVEGYMDALTCHQFGFGEVVAVLGTGLSAEQAGLLARLANEVVLAYDADPAGDAAAWHGLAVLQEAGAQVAVAELPVGKDPDEVLRTEGPEALRAALEGARPLVRYLVHRAVGARGVGTLTPEQRWAVAMKVVPYLARLPAGVRRAEVEWVAREFVLPEPHEFVRAVEAESSRRSRHSDSKSWHPRVAREAARNRTTRSGAEAAEELVLAACLQSADRLHRVAARLSIHDFRRPTHKALAEHLRALAETAAAGAGAGAGQGGPDAVRAPGLVLLDLPLEPELRALIGRLLAVEVDADDAVLSSCLATMRWARLREEVDSLRAEQRRLAAAGMGLESAEMRSLTRRLTELTAELARSARGGSDG
jgi:DNA primase